MSKDVSEDKLLAYGSYSQIADLLQHYNSIQATYRTFASTWLLATFIGIGYALASREVNIPFHPLVVVAFISLASATGIFLMWHMDLIVCEQSIAATVHGGIELEKQNPWLPRYYHNINRMGTLMGYIKLKALFYIGCLSILFITMGASLTFYVAITNSPLRFFIPIFTLFLIILVGYAMITTMRKSDPYIQIDELKRKNLV